MSRCAVIRRRHETAGDCIRRFAACVSRGLQYDPAHTPGYQMTDHRRPESEAEQSRAFGERLESWKDIAAYFRRDVRTVQRWEQTDGLPVHRHKRAHRPIPYAYKAELDAWWTGRSENGAEAASDDVPQPDVVRFPTRAVIAALVLAGVAATAGAYWISRSGSPRRSGAAVPIARTEAANSNRSSAPPAAAEKNETSIAVLPFLDLTEGMKEEEFADGMTEELIDRLSKIPGVQVPPPTSSFYFKNKKVPVADIARSLGVSYVLDGSVRKSGTRLRVAARLVRPNDGYVIWSESYDRPWADTLGVQDEIAAEVTKALKSSIG